MSEPARRRPDLSVIIPTHNRARYLPAAINSVIEQRGVDIEVIVVDDASTDDTSAVLSSFGDRIRVMRNDRSGERGAARNQGARAAAADVIAFLDSDDVWLPDKARRQLEKVESGEASVTGIRFVDESGRVTSQDYVPPIDARERVCFENAFLGTSSTLLLHKDDLLQVGGFPEELQVQGSEDWLLLNRLIGMGKHIVVVPEPLVSCRIHAGNSTADAFAVASHKWAAVERLIDDGFASGRCERKLRGRTAGAIARQLAAQAEWLHSMLWLRRALGSGSLVEAARALVLVPASAGRGVLKRRLRSPS